jgi:hypothetical protein
MKTENWFFVFVKPQAVYWSPLFSIFQIITGMVFFLLGLLIFLSLILNNIDKAMHSSAQKGYILNNGTLPNPMDMALVFLQNTFPLDYILYLGECQFGYWVSRFDSPKLYFFHGYQYFHFMIFRRTAFIIDIVLFQFLNHFTF